MEISMNLLGLTGIKGQNEILFFNLDKAKRIRQRIFGLEFSAQIFGVDL